MPLPTTSAELRYQRAGWGGWLGDQAKALDFRDHWRAHHVALQLDRPPLPRRYWLGAWVSRSRSRFLRLCVAAARTHLQQVRALAEHHAALVTELEKVVARTGTEIPPDRMLLMKASSRATPQRLRQCLGATKRIVVWDTTLVASPTTKSSSSSPRERHYVLNTFPRAGPHGFLSFLHLLACAGLPPGWLASSGSLALVPQEDGAENTTALLSGTALSSRAASSCCSSSSQLPVLCWSR